VGSFYILYELLVFVRIFIIKRLWKKMCTKCGHEKKVTDFPFRNKEKNIRHNGCVECWKIIRKESYENNKKTTFDRNKKNRAKNVKWYKELKNGLECYVCGENYTACLDFHHKNADEKEIEVSLLANDTVSIDRIKKEIDKCVVLCANCHRKYHDGEENVIKIIDRL
jgi:transcription elongation factor Elf1